MGREDSSEFVIAGGWAEGELGGAVFRLRAEQRCWASQLVWYLGYLALLVRRRCNGSAVREKEDIESETA
jgi:hypothetical protein